MMQSDIEQYQYQFHVCNAISVDIEDNVDDDSDCISVTLDRVPLNSA